MYGQPISSIFPYGGYPVSSGSQVSPYLQSQQLAPFSQGIGAHPFAQQSQPFALPLQQLVQAVTQQLVQLHQLNQQQSQWLQQLIQVVPQQLQQIHQFLQYLPQVIQSQMHQPQPGPGLGGFGAWQQPFGGSPAWTGGSMSQQGTTAGQSGGGANLGFPTLAGQSGPVM